MRRFLWALIIGGSLLTAACLQRVLESAPAPDVPTEVPEGYRGIYREIDAEMNRQLPIVPLPWQQKKTQTIFGVELEPAGSGRGEALLDEPVLADTALALDRMKALGVQSVSIGLHYPLLARSHPRAKEYRDFYRRVAAEVRKRGLALIVELGSAPREPEPSRTAVDDRGMKRPAFVDGLRAAAAAVIADIRPEYLTLLSEPDTQTRNTGLTFSPAEFAATVGRVAAGLDRDGVKLGAGAGSWLSNEYFRALAGIPELDYLDFHIFPVQYGFASDRILKAEEAARAGGKRVSIGAAWLYKASGREFSRIERTEVFARDAFSFWQPLDENFIQLIVNLARRIDAEFCSFFRTKYLYAYIEHTPETSRLSAGQITELSERAAAENIIKGKVSRTGERFRELIQK